MAVNAASGFRSDQENAAYIGAGVTLKGEISVPDSIIIDGEIEGDVTARAVSVGPSGVVRGKLIATEADVSGRVTDHLEVKQLLTIRATGRVEGRVTYGEIELEKGAVITGDLSATDEHRTVAKPVSAKVVAVERVEAPPATAKPSSSSIDRINEAVRFARGAPAKQSGLHLASEAEGAKRGGRPPPPGRKSNV